MLKIKKRTITVKNTLFFVVLSLLFLHVMTALSEGGSAFSLKQVNSFLNNQKWLIYYTFVTLLSVYQVINISRYLLPVFILTISTMAFKYFMVDFSKVILLLDFIYLICGHYFVLLWFSELRDPIYNPGYSSLDIDRKPSNKIEVNVVLADGSKLACNLTNWGEQSCFVCFKKNNFIWSEIKYMRFIEVYYKGLTVFEAIRPCSLYDGGCGLKIINNTDANDKWSVFFRLTKDRKLVSDWRSLKTSTQLLGG